MYMRICTCAADVDEAGGEGADAAGRRVRGRSTERDY